MADTHHQTAEALLAQADAVLLSTIDPEGYPNTRALLPIRHRNGLRTLYFSTNTSTRKVDALRGNPKACVYAYDRAALTGVMLRGGG